MNFTQQSIFDRSKTNKVEALNALNHDLLLEIRKMGRDLSGIRQAHQQLTDKVNQFEDWRRRPFPPSVVKTYIKVAHHFFNGWCPCCGDKPILGPNGGRLPSLEVDHFRGPKWNHSTEGWPVCDRCHKNLTHGYLSRDGWVLQAFRAFQMRVNQYVSTRNGQGSLF